MMAALELTVNAIGWTLIHSIWLGALAAAAYAVPAAQMRNHAPQSAYAWGLSCLLALVAALLVVFVHEFESVRSNADAQAIAVAYAALPVAASALPEATSSVAPRAIGDFIEPLLPLLVLLWAIAVLAIGGGLVRSQLALRRLVTAGVGLPHLATPVIELARYFGVSRPIAVVSSAVARVPFVIGHFSPVIVLPLEIATGMPWPQLKLILAHEIAHLRRADYLVNWLQIALEVLLFFHPAVRWLSEELRRLREACCDDMVVAYAGGRGDYARALLSLEEFRHDAPLLAPSAVAGGLLWRVQRIAGRAPHQRGALQRIVLPAVVLSVMATLIAGGLQIRPGSGPRELTLPQVELFNAGMELPPASTQPSSWRAQLPALSAARATSNAPQAINPPSIAPLPTARTPATQEAPMSRAQILASAEIATPSLSPAPVIMPDARKPRPESSVKPKFPSGVRLLDDSLTVELGYTLTAGGDIADIQVLQSPANAGAFVESARAALLQWHYAEQVASELAGERLRHRFVFRDQAAPDSAPGGCSMIPGSRICVVNQQPERRAESPMSGRRCDSTTGTRLCRR